MNKQIPVKCATTAMVIVLLLGLAACSLIEPQAAQVPPAVKAQPTSQVSPLKTPTPFNDEGTPLPPRPTLTPPWWGTLTPVPQPTLPSWADPKWRAEYVPPTWAPFSKSDDVVKAVMNSQHFQAALNDPQFKTNLDGAQPGTPVFVNRLSLPLDQTDYYLVPFYKNGKLTYIHQWLVKDGQGASGPGWSPAPREEWPCCPPLSAAEAKRLAEAKGYRVTGEPKLVYRDLARPMTSPVFPFWEVPTTASEPVYVIYDGYSTAVWNQKDCQAPKWGLYPTPGPFPTPEWIPFNGPDDVARALMSSAGFKMSLESNDKPYLDGAQPGTPVFVTNLDPQGLDYYIVPFYKNGKLSYIMQWSIKDGKGISGDGGAIVRPEIAPPCCPELSAAEARQLVEAKGYRVTSEPRLVYRSLAQPFTDYLGPFWEIRTVDSQIWYVLWRPRGQVWNVADVKPLR